MSSTDGVITMEHMSLLDFCVGSLFVIYYAYNWYKTPSKKHKLLFTPKTNNSLTFFSRYIAFFIIYAFLWILVYFLMMLIIFYSPGWIETFLGPGIKEKINSASAPLAAVIIIITVFPNVPFAKKTNEEILSKLWDMGRIPSQALALSKEMESADFHFDHNLKVIVAKCVQQYGIDFDKDVKGNADNDEPGIQGVNISNFIDSDFVINELLDNIDTRDVRTNVERLYLRARDWAKIRSLLWRIEDWKTRPGYGRFVSQHFDEFDDMNKHFEFVTDMFKRYYLSSVNYREDKVSQDIINNLHDQLETSMKSLTIRVCQFIAPSILTVCSGYDVAREQLKEIGFKLPSYGYKNPFKIEDALSIILIVFFVQLALFSFNGIMAEHYTNKQEDSSSTKQEYYLSSVYNHFSFKEAEAIPFSYYRFLPLSFDKFSKDNDGSEFRKKTSKIWQKVKVPVQTTAMYSSAMLFCLYWIGKSRKLIIEDAKRYSRRDIIIPGVLSALMAISVVIFYQYLLAWIMTGENPAFFKLMVFARIGWIFTIQVVCVSIGLMLVCNRVPSAKYRFKSIERSIDSMYVGLCTGFGGILCLLLTINLTCDGKYPNWVCKPNEFSEGYIYLWWFTRGFAIGALAGFIIPTTFRKSIVCHPDEIIFKNIRHEVQGLKKDVMALDDVNVFTQDISRVCAYISSADGNIGDNELYICSRSLLNFFKENNIVDIDPILFKKTLNTNIDILKSTKDEINPKEEYLAFLDNYKSSQAIKNMFILLSISISSSDGVICKNEINYIEEISLKLGENFDLETLFSRYKFTGFNFN